MSACEVGEYGAVGDGCHGVEGHDSAARDALGDAQADEGTELKDAAGEVIFVEGDIEGQIQENVRAEAAVDVFRWQADGERCRER